MPGYQWQARFAQIVVDYMQVGTAYAACQDPQQQLRGSGYRDRDLAGLQTLPWSVQHHCAHFRFPVHVRTIPFPRAARIDPHQAVPTLAAAQSAPASYRAR